MAPDDAGFHDFVEARWTSLVRYAYVLTGDVGEAEDVVQSALESSWRRWSSIRSDRPEVYVRTAVARQVISRHRWRSRRPGERPAGDALPEAPAASHGPDGHALRDLVWRELQELPPRMRAVVVLRLWEDMSEAEVARVLGCSAGSVKSQLSRGTERLRQRTGLREAVGIAPPAVGPGAAPDAPPTRDARRAR
jgi:RNA polymerase sigma-70 factor (sigma-E family)